MCSRFGRSLRAAGAQSAVASGCHRAGTGARALTPVLRTAALSLLALLGAASGFVAPLSAHPVIDCPLRDQPYSADSPLVDVLQKPEARAVLEREAPALLKNIPPEFARPPTIATVMSLRMITVFMHVPNDTLAKIDRELAALPVTAADGVTRCARYDDERPDIRVPKGRPRLLVFEKISGFRDSPSSKQRTPRCATWRPAMAGRWSSPTRPEQ